MLTKAAEALQRQHKKRDVVARIGGDEYAAILPDTTLDEAMKIAEQVKQSFGRGGDISQSEAAYLWALQQGACGSKIS